MATVPYLWWPGVGLGWPEAAAVADMDMDLPEEGSVLELLLPAFLLDLLRGGLTEGEVELAYNLTVIYGLSLLSMIVLYRVLKPALAPPPPLAALAALPSLAATMALVKARRSVMPKDLSGDMLARAEVEAVLEAATWAPTHHRNQPWRFLVLEGAVAISGYLDRLDAWYADHREEIAQEESAKFQAKLEGCRSTWPSQASHVVVLGMVRQAGATRAAEWEEIAAVGCAVQNLHLALTAIPGAAGFWSSHTWCRRARDGAELREYLGLADPEDRVLGAFVMGRVADAARFRSKRDPWAEKTRWESE